MAGCRIITKEETRTRVHVIGDKRPKWVNHNDPKWHISDSVDAALAWLNQGEKSV